MRQPDENMLDCLFSLGQCLGLLPMSKYILFSKLYVAVLAFLSIIGTIFSLLDRINGFWTVSNLTQIILETLQCPSELLFMLSCFLNSFFREHKWTELMEDIQKTDEVLSRENLKVHSNMVWCVLRLIAYHVIFISLHTCEIINWVGKNGNFEQGYVMSRVVMYYKFYVILMVVYIMKWLRNRYQFLNKMFIDLLEKKKQTVIVCQEFNENFRMKLFHIKQLYIAFNRFMKLVNDIFGWSIFLCIVSNVVLCLVNINYIFQFTGTYDNEFNTAVFALTGAYTGVYSFATIVLVMACESVEKSGAEIISTCYLYQDQMERATSRNELIIFADVAKYLAPQFSAAGFFKVNQNMLSTLFAALITYLIIIIQFNMVL